MLKSYDTPMWTLNSFNKNSVKYKCVIIQLPKTKNQILLQIEFQQLFNKIIAQEIINLIMTMSGYCVPGIITKIESFFKEKKNYIVKDEDILLVTFIKDYFFTTKTCFVPLTEKGKNIKIEKETILNNIVRRATFESFINTKLFIQGQKIYFTSSKNDSEINFLQELNQCKNRLLV